MKRFISSLVVCLTALGGIVLIGSCNKNDPYDLIEPGSFIHFVGSKIQSYPVRTASPPVYNVQIGTTDVSGEARTVTFKVTSPTGAVEGTQYTLGAAASKTVTIPAGQATAVIPVQGLFSGYPPGRIDTLVFTFSEPSIKPATFLDTVKLAIGDICAESAAFVLNDFIGTYANTNELFGTGAYGPYTTTISSITPLTATTATMRVTNIWDNGWGPIDFTLDWTNMANKTTRVIPQTAVPGSNAGDINPAYSGQTVAVRVHTTQAQTGTFLSCSKRFVLNMQLGVTGVGYFAALYTVTMLQ